MSSLDTACVLKSTENLCHDLKNIDTIASKDKLRPSAIPKEGGIYAFWWIGDQNEFTNKITNCPYQIKGLIIRRRAKRSEW